MCGRLYESLRPVPSPYLVNGELSDKAKEEERCLRN